jgi:hypothetical protein
MRLLWLPPRVAFFLISETHVVISSVSYPFDTTRSLSAEARPQQHSLSLSLLRRSLARSVCSVSPPACPVHRRQLRALWGSRLISHLRKLALQQAGRPRVRDSERGQSGHRPRRPPRCRRGRDATSDPPPRPRSPPRKSSSKVEIN